MPPRKASRLWALLGSRTWGTSRDGDAAERNAVASVAAASGWPIMAVKWRANGARDNRADLREQGREWRR
jgi:hypothetical protein